MSAWGWGWGGGDAGRLRARSPCGGCPGLNGQGTDARQALLGSATPGTLCSLPRTMLRARHVSRVSSSGHLLRIHCPRLLGHLHFPLSPVGGGQVSARPSANTPNLLGSGAGGKIRVEVSELFLFKGNARSSFTEHRNELRGLRQRAAVHLGGGGLSRPPGEVTGLHSGTGRM